MSRMLKITGLTVENFQGFGQIVDAGLKDPRIVEEDFTFWNCLGQIQLADPVDFAFLEVRKRSKTFSKIERHHKSPEAFYALRGDCLMLAAPLRRIRGTPIPIRCGHSTCRRARGSSTISAPGTGCLIPWATRAICWSLGAWVPATRTARSWICRISGFPLP